MGWAQSLRHEGFHLTLPQPPAWPGAPRMKLSRTTRRRFLLTLLLATPGAVAVDARWIEPTRLRVKRLQMANGRHTRRLVHFTDLILAGHSHGGQVRVPFYGPIMLPFGVDEYDLGLFHTAPGPLYVNPGIGWFPVPIRFNCRPEITVIDI
jgi:hypothetical protein